MASQWSLWVSVLQPLLSQQLHPIWQVPPQQTPPEPLSEQVELSGAPSSAGQLALEPMQVSAMSHGPAAGRHTSVAGWKLSVGQAALEPVHVSAMSHGPAAGRHTSVAGWNLSGGQAALEPVHVSATSHRSVGAAGRHT